MDSSLNPLKRLLWRYDAGYFLKELIRDRYEYERRALLSRRRKTKTTHIGGEYSSVELSIAAEFEKEMGDADASIRTSDFRAALRALTKADALLKKLARAEEAAEVIGQGQQTLLLLKAFVGVEIERLSHLDLLLGTAKNGLKNGQYRSSQTIGGVCLEYAKALCEEDGTEASMALSMCNQVSEQLQSYERVKRVFPSDRTLERAGRLVIATTRAMEKRRLALVSILLQELEDQLAGAVVLLNELDRCSTALTVKAGDYKLRETPDRGGADQRHFVESSILLEERLRRLTARAQKADEP